MTDTVTGTAVAAATKSARERDLEKYMMSKWVEKVLYVP